MLDTNAEMARSIADHLLPKCRIKGEDINRYNNGYNWLVSIVTGEAGVVSGTEFQEYSAWKAKKKPKPSSG